jgi:hypothetical protein
MVANCPTQHWITSFECIEDGALCNRTLDFDADLAADARQRSQMRWEYDLNHGRLWTSTDTTAGRSRTMGAQVSPALAEA